MTCVELANEEVKVAHCIPSGKISKTYSVIRCFMANSDFSSYNCIVSYECSFLIPSVKELVINAKYCIVNKHEYPVAIVVHV